MTDPKPYDLQDLPPDPPLATTTAGPGIFDAGPAKTSSPAPRSTASSARDDFDPVDVAQNRAMAILAYIGVLVIVPLVAARHSRFARHHTNQGFVLFLWEMLVAALWFLTAPFALILVHIAFCGLVPFYLLWFADFILVVLAVLGVVHAMKGTADRLPLIGHIDIIE